MDGQTIRSTVRAIIVEQGRLLLCRYAGATGDYYVCPGGGQRFGESMPDALQRECIEEIGCSVSVGRLFAVADGIFHIANDARKSVRHQTEHHFLCTIENGQTAHVGHAPDADLIGIEWVPLGRLSGLRVYPAQLARLLAGGGPGGGYIGVSG